MTVVRKPTQAEKFIQKAKMEINRQVIKKRKPAPKAKAKTTKLTFYMDRQTYLAWQKYKLEQLAAGNKVTFQGTVEQLLEKLLT